jgi:hypothetical protein
MKILALTILATLSISAFAQSSCVDGVGEGCSKNAEVCENLPENCVSCKEKCLNAAAENRSAKDLNGKKKTDSQKSDAAVQH